jgi:hypothetical protein
LHTNGTSREESGISGTVLKFVYTENPMSAYYDGQNSLKLTANWIDKNVLFSPTISKF